MGHCDNFFCRQTNSPAREDIAGLVSKPYYFDQLREVLKRLVEGEGMEILNV
jgi:hypothetical protein